MARRIAMGHGSAFALIGGRYDTVQGGCTPQVGDYAIYAGAGERQRMQRELAKLGLRLQPGYYNFHKEAPVVAI